MEFSQNKTIRPTEDEVRDWLLSTTRHSMRMEFCLQSMGIGNRDPQRPHDIVGEGNKFEWEVIQGFSTENRPEIDHFTHVVPALTRHRAQYHHQKWNHEDSGATDDEMLLGATDAICSLLENRLYQGGSHSIEEIRSIIEDRNPPYRRPWMTKALDQVNKLKMPDMGQIRHLDRIPNLGLPLSIYETTVNRVRETILMLRQDHGFKLNNL